MCRDRNVSILNHMLRWSAWFAVVLCIAHLRGHAQDASAHRKPVRALPPEWSEDVLDLFFDDVRDVLKGARPDYAKLNSARKTTIPPGASPASFAGENGGDVAWSDLIDAVTIETEIKRCADLLARELNSRGDFRSGGFDRCRDHFSLLASLFAVAGEYEGPIRWQRTADTFRDVLAEAARECDDGTDAAFQLASRRQLELAELIRGGRPEIPPARLPADWSEVCQRPRLMKRMETAQQQRLQKWLANPQQFVSNQQDVIHEAEMLAMLAEIIRQESFDYWDDVDFSAYAGELQASAQRLVQAAAEDDFPRARETLGEATKACSQCHEGYRG